jgi:hypothetical protein
VTVVERGLIYIVVLFLIMIVYTGQNADCPRVILRQSLRKTAKFALWNAAFVLVMEVCFYLFIE